MVKIDQMTSLSASSWLLHTGLIEGRKRRETEDGQS
jgi:hypothetical protein